VPYLPSDQEARIYLVMLAIMAVLVVALITIYRRETKRTERAEQRAETAERLLAYRRPTEPVGFTVTQSPLTSQLAREAATRGEHRWSS
jgi:hypothetical protein